MESRVVVIGIEEYKELLTLKVRNEIETKYTDEIAELKEELDEQKRLASYWYERFVNLDEERVAKKGGE